MEASYGKILTKLRASFNSGKTKSISFRKAQLKALLAMLESNTENICEALKKDLGKSKFESVVMEIMSTKNEILCALSNLDKWMQPESPEKSVATLMDDLSIVSEPLGVVLVIGAWNYPINVAVAPLVCTIAAGNCFILKPSEVSPNTAKLLSILIPRYLDPECFEVVLGGPAETTALLANKFDHIFYTGSTTVGKIIYEAAAKHLTPVTLELGGKSPTYIDESVNMKFAARRILWGKCANAGQTCIAPDYILCTKKVEELFITEAKKILNDWYGGDIEKSPDLGRIVNVNHFNRLNALLVPEKIAVGGKTEQSQLFIPPTILSGVSKDDTVMKSEIFGPILPIVNIKNTEEAIEYINSGEKPLTMYIFSNKKSVQDEFISRTSAGSVLCNDTLLHIAVDTLPFGGVGASGTGAYHGKYGFDAVSHKKPVMRKTFNAILEKAASGRYPPYSDAKLKKLEELLKPRKLWFPKTFLMLLMAFVLGGLTSALALKYVN